MNALNVTRLGLAVLAIGISIGSSLNNVPDPGLDLLVESIEGSGTTLTEKVCTEESKEAYGYYHFGPKVDELVICTNNVKGDKAVYGETLKHEAIHIAQACKKWESATNYKEEWHAKKVAESYDIEILKAKHDKSEWANELEAYSLERSPAAYISGVVDAACNG